MEEVLKLPDGRTLAYSHSGPSDSKLVLIWFHGLFSVGDAANPPKPIRERNALFIAPTLPGWGNTSPTLPGKTFAETVVSDTLALLEHLRPQPSNDSLRIYVAGGSFGTVPTQIVFGAPYDRFPYGRHIVGMLLMAPFSPFREDVNYRKGLCWRDWISVGPLTRIVPGRMVQRLMKSALAGKVRDVASAEAFLQKEFFADMDEEEKARYAAWRERTGSAEGEFPRRMAEGMVKSVSVSWEGFLGVADAIHSDWGFKIKEFDEEHARKPVVLALGRGDTSLRGMAKFLQESYKNVRVEEYEGGHLASAWSMDEVLEEMFTAGGD
ncbi:Alpha/Beta hydrolase protein [Cubamyces menziesii]|nr:Alpha/Beta hydrolase protein [Cubamyces menziesii]